MKTLRLIAATLLLLATFATALSAAPAFQIEWFTIDGGGGTSTSGPYQVNGTVGQPDATSVALAGGPYTLSGGFWAGWTSSKPGEPPALSIQLVAEGLILSWPATATGFSLEQTADIASREWMLSPVENGSLVPLTDRLMFYRLRQP